MGDKFNRDTNEVRSKDSQIAREVQQLLREAAKENVNDQEVWAKLKGKYGNNPELLSGVFEAYKERLKYIYKKALKFKRLIFDRYAGLQLSAADLIKKAKKYQHKYKLTEDEFQMFIALSLTDKSILAGIHNLPHTKMASTLGYDVAMATSSKLNVNETELKTVEEIIQLHAETKLLHSQIVIQSLTYTSCAPEAIAGKYSKDKHNAFNYIHPVIAALFIPKIKMLDECMLIANIGYIVKCKFEGKQLMTKPDFDLYWSMINDPNDHVCTMPALPGAKESSAILDLKRRFELQTRIWDCVMSLRQGQYYHDKVSTASFLTVLDNCRNNVFDSPDLTYVRDEGAILRRLLSAFSIRPTIVSIHRLYGVLAGPGGIPNSPLDASGLNQITTVPMVTLRLPLSIAGDNRAVVLEESLTQPQWFVENKMIVPKALQLVHSRDVLFFYVNRRFQTINLSRLRAPYNFSNLPMTIAGFEALNSHPVNFNNTMSLMGDLYELRSVVCVDALKSKKNLIIGCSTCIIVPQGTGIDETILLYDPQGAAQQSVTDPSKDPSDPEGKYKNNEPISVIPNHLHATTGYTDSFKARACTSGTIFMYEKTSANSSSPFFGVSF